MARNLQDLRNIGIIAHIDAGKTTLTERMLFYTGTTHKMGEVDKGTTETDFDPEEAQRGITIYSACVTFNWKKIGVNLIDTPGHVDFTAEVERSLRVLDGGVVVFSAREGVEAQSETVWRQADKYGVPRICFINKMDREGANFEDVLAQIHTRLQANPVVINVPIGSGPPHVKDSFQGIIDLVEMKQVEFDSESKGVKYKLVEIPSDLLDYAVLWREKMIEQLCDFSDELMELVLEGSNIPVELLHRVIRQATLHQMIVPLLCGSALDFIGVQPVLDAVAAYLPSPADMPPVEGTNPKKRNAAELRKPDSSQPFCGLVFKIVADRHGDLCYVRVYSGTLKAGTRALVGGKDKKENMAQLWHIQADHRDQVPQVEAGDIVGVIGLRNAVTGDTLCDPQHPIVLESIVFPETVISMAIEPETSVERKKLGEVLVMMKRQDPTFAAQENAETGQTLISGMGELHLEVIKNRLLRDFHVKVKVHRPRVSYRETIVRSVEVEGSCQRVVEGQQLFAKIRIRFEPVGIEQKAVTVINSAGDSLLPEFSQIAVESLREAIGAGGSLGFPLLNVRVTLLDGEYREGESNDMAFRIAASNAFEVARKKAGIVLLEPIMKLEITTPEEYLGNFESDLNQRGGIITNTYFRGKTIVIDAQSPLEKLFGYSSAMRSLSQGRASCSMEPLMYGPAPQEVKEKFML